MTSSCHKSGLIDHVGEVVRRAQQVDTRRTAGRIRRRPSMSDIDRDATWRPAIQMEPIDYVLQGHPRASCGVSMLLTLSEFATEPSIQRLCQQRRDIQSP